MLKLGQLVKRLDQFCPQEWAYDFDHVGLQIGKKNSEISRALVSLDWSSELVDRANEANAQLLLCHHPLIWEPLSALTEKNRAQMVALEIIENRLSLFAMHTNWDAAPGGINDALAERLELKNVQPFGQGPDIEQFKLVFFAPAEVVDPLIDTLSACGAGTLGNYDRCAFMHEGTGTFRGNESAKPAIGEIERIESVSEVRVEMIVPAANVASVASELRKHHPYEEPAFDFFQLKGRQVVQPGRIGELPNAVSLAEFVKMVDARLDTQSLAWGDPAMTISKVAVMGGAADSAWRQALEAGADAYVTGEVKQDRALDASSASLAIVSSGHYATEQPGMEALADALTAVVPEVEWELYVPPRGSAGRPF